MPKFNYILIKIAPNHLSGDQLSIGLIAFDDKDLKVRFSPERQNLLNRLIENGSDTFDYISQQINANLKEGLSKLQEKVSVKSQDGQWVSNYLDYLQRYSNGTLQFSKPQLITAGLSDQSFDQLFEKLFENPGLNGITPIFNDLAQIPESKSEEKQSLGPVSLEDFTVNWSSEEEFRISVQDKPFLEQLYLSLKRVEEIPCLPSSFLLKMYPFNQGNSSERTYISAFSLVTRNFYLLNFFENIQISEEGQVSYQSLDQIKDIDSYQYKLNFIIRKLNDFLISEIEGDRREFHTSIYLRDNSPINLANLFFELRFKNAVDLLSNENSNDIKNSLINAYTHYQFGNYTIAYQLFNELASFYKNSKEEFYYFLCLYNIKKLDNHIYSAHAWVDLDESNVLSEEIDKIDINIIFNKLEVTPITKEAVSLIKDGQLFYRSFQKITDISKKIIDTFYLDQKGGRSSNNHLILLRAELVNLVEFITRNYLVFDQFQEYNQAINLTIEAFFASHAIPEKKQQETWSTSRLMFFDDYLLVIIVLYGIPKELIKYLNRYHLRTIQYQSNNDFFWVFVDNFLDKQNNLEQILSQLKERKNYRFQDKYNLTFNNILILLTLLPMESSKFDSLFIQIINAIHQNVVLIDNEIYSSLRSFMIRKQELFISNQLAETLLNFLSFHILYTPPNGKHYNSNLILCICAMLETYYPNFKIRDTKTINSIITVIQKVRKSDVVYLYPIVSDDFSEVIQQSILKNLETEFSNSLYFQAAKNKIIPYKPLFPQFLQSGQTEDIIALAYHLDLDLSEASFQEIAQKSDYYNWLINLETFDYTKFKIHWLTKTHGNLDIFLNKFKNVPAIKTKLEAYLKTTHSEQLRKIYFDYFI